MQLGRPRPWRLGLAVASALAFTAGAPTAALAAFHKDTTPLPSDVTGASAGTAAAHASSGGSAVIRMLFGLAIVVAVIYAIYWVLKRASKKSKGAIKSDGGMVVLSTTALAPSRALHLVQVGEELVLVGSAEQSVTPIRVYSAEEVRRLGFEVGATAPLQPFTPTEERARSSFGVNFLEELKRRTVRG